LEEKIKEYENNSIAISINSTNKTKKDIIEKVKVVDINIQSSLEKSNFNNKDLIINSKSKLGPIKEESSPIPKNSRYSSYNDNNDIKLMNSIDDEILGKEQNLNDNSSNKNIELFTIKNKEKIFLSRNEEIKKENNESNFNPKTEIKKIRRKKNFNFEEKKFDISKINKIKKQCGDQVKDYSDEKIQKILDENGGDYRETITDIMLRLSRILSN